MPSVSFPVGFSYPSLHSLLDVIEQAYSKGEIQLIRIIEGAVEVTYNDADLPVSSGSIWSCSTGSSSFSNSSSFLNKLPVPSLDLNKKPTGSFSYSSSKSLNLQIEIDNLSPRRGDAIRALEESDFNRVFFNTSNGNISSPTNSKYSRSSPSTPSNRSSLDIVSSQLGIDNRTTLMLRNLPRSITQDQFYNSYKEILVNIIDFLYLPFDVSKQQNFGYVFINVSHKNLVKDIYRAFHGKPLNGELGLKSCQVAYARLQGKEAFIAQFNRDAVMRLPKNLRPLIVDGPATKPITLNLEAELAKSCTREDSGYYGGEDQGRGKSWILDCEEPTLTDYELEKIAAAVAEFALPEHTTTVEGS
jgi:RNA recognition motif 2